MHAMLASYISLADLSLFFLKPAIRSIQTYDYLECMHGNASYVEFENDWGIGSFEEKFAMSDMGHED